MAFCDNFIHLRCLTTPASTTKLNKAFMNIVEENPNLIWMCNECAKLMKMMRFKSTVTSLGNAINAITEKQETVHAEIQKQLTKQGQQIAQLSRRIALSSPCRQDPDHVLRGPPPKRRRDDDSAGNKPLLGGIKIADTNVITVPEPVELFWVYLSRIHPSVQPDAIEKLVKDCLQSEDNVKAIPLVKKGVDTSRLNFISYKVGVDPKFRDAALNVATWPKGILFREFEDLSAKNLWLPRQNTPTLLVPQETGTPFSTPIPDVDLTC